MNHPMSGSVPMVESKRLPLGAGMRLKKNIFSRGDREVGNISILLLKFLSPKPPSHYRVKDGGKNKYPDQSVSVGHLSQGQKNTHTNHNCVLCLNINMLVF